MGGDVLNYAIFSISVLFVLFLISLVIIVRLMYELNSIKYELEISKINCQKDLNRLEDRINEIGVRRDKYTEQEIEKLEKIQQSLVKIIQGKIDDVEKDKKFLKG